MLDNITLFFGQVKSFWLNFLNFLILQQVMSEKYASLNR